MKRLDEADDADAHHPALSADGRYLAYLSQTSAHCTLVLHDFETRRTHRQSCPETPSAVKDGEQGIEQDREQGIEQDGEQNREHRVIFSAEGDRLHWRTPGQSGLIILPNPLAAPRP